MKINYDCVFFISKPRDDSSFLFIFLNFFPVQAIQIVKNWTRERERETKYDKIWIMIWKYQLYILLIRQSTVAVVIMHTHTHNNCIMWTFVLVRESFHQTWRHIYIYLYIVFVESPRSNIAYKFVILPFIHFPSWLKVHLFFSTIIQ
jgi:hypothetical protein